jgi:hypothetical protein
MIVQGKRHFHFPITNPLNYYLNWRADKDAASQVFFQRSQLPVSGIMCWCFAAGTDHEEAWQNEPLSPAVRALHGKRHFSPTIPAWTQVVPHRDCAYAGDLSHRHLVAGRHGSRP